MRRHSLKRTLQTVFTLLLIQISWLLNAQKLITIDLSTVLQPMPTLPASLDALHEHFSQKQATGKKYNFSALTDLRQQVLTWIKEIHDETIQAKIQANRRSDMRYEIQYEDERLRISIRPLKATQLAKQTANASSTTREIVKQLIDLEQSFDWLEYYKLYDQWFKEVQAKLAAWDSKNNALSDKIPIVKTAYGEQKDEKKAAELSRQMLTEKLQIHRELFDKHIAVWTTYFRKYTRQNLVLQELLQKIKYGKELPADEKRILLPALADVQARGLEAIEKMTWQAMLFLSHGEVWSGERTTAEFYMH